MSLQFQWSKRKAEKNINKHGKKKGDRQIIVTLAEAAGITEPFVSLCVLCELCERCSLEMGSALDTGHSLKCPTLSQIELFSFLRLSGRS